MNQVDTVGEYVSIKENSPVSHAAYAWSESTKWDAVFNFLDYLKDRGWLKGAPLIGSSSSSFSGRVTVAGYSRIEEQATNTDSSQAFVAMWFGKGMDEVFDKGIKPGIEDAGYDAMRIDRKEDTDKIDDEIIAEIKRSRFVVTDFTHGADGARGSVYYEAGFARGLGVKVISTCHKSVADKLAFDTRQYNHIIWEKPDELRERLKLRIEAVIGRGPGKGRSN